MGPDMASHTMRLVHHRGEVTGYSTCSIFADLVAAFYSMLRDLCFAVPDTREGLAALYQRMGFTPDDFAPARKDM